MLPSVLLVAIVAATATTQAPDTVVPPPSTLSGEWRFRTGDDPAWAAPSVSDSGWVSIPVPGVWEDAIGDYDGIAWYRRSVEIPPELAEGPLALDFGLVGDAFEVYWNGVPIGGRGQFPPDFVEAPMLPKPLLVPERALEQRPEGPHTVAVRVYNGYAYGGLMDPVRIGRYDWFMGRPDRGEMAIFVLISFFLAIGLYHLAFFIRRPKARENLHFAVFTTLVAAYGVIYSDHFRAAIHEIIHPYRLGLIIFLLAATTLIILLQHLSDLQLSRWGRGFRAGFLLTVPVVAVLPLARLPDLQVAIDAAVMVGTVVMMVRIHRSASRSADYSRLVEGGFAFFALTVGYDILSEYGWVPLAFVIPWVSGVFWVGMLVLVLSVGIATAGRWATAEANALVDPLTGVSRRHVFEDALQREAERLRRAGGRVAVVLIDLDHFKEVNDTYGHSAGDQVLAQVGNLLRRTIRNSDVAARLGGEEFGVLLYDSDLEGALTFAERFRGFLAEARFSTPEASTLGITACLGVITGEDLVDPKQMLDEADRALYRAKHEGRNRIVVAPQREVSGSGAAVDGGPGRI